MRALTLACAVLVLAGCFGKTTTPAVDYPAVEQSVEDAARAVLVADHGDANGHFDRSHHKGAYNVQLVGYSNGVDDSGDPNKIPAGGSYTELAVTDQHAYLARYSADGSYGGFSILDIQDPAKPRFVGAFKALQVADVEVDPEEHFAYASTQRDTPQQIAQAVQTNMNAESATPRGIYIVDLTDKSKPTLDSFVPLPSNGPHTITYLRHPNGSDYLIAATYDLVTDPVTGAIAANAPLTQRVIVFLVAPNPVSGLGLPVAKVGLFPVAQFQETETQTPGTGNEEPRLVFPHDTRVQIHPFTGQVVMEVAYWDRGVKLVDITHLPTAPTGVPDVAATPLLSAMGTWTDFSPSAQNNIHLVKSFEEPRQGADGALIQVTVAEPEIISAADETGQLTFLDTSDPARIEKLGHWTLPTMDPPLFVTDLDFSPHNFDTFGGKVAVAHYHAGLWIIDASTPDNLAHPRSVGFYMGNVTRENSPVFQPDFWGVFEHNGLLYASDESTGLHILRYTGP